MDEIRTVTVFGVPLKKNQMKPKKKPITDPLDRMLQYHKQTCAMHEYSLQEKRHCSCGRDEAVKVVATMRERIMELETKEGAE